MSSYEVYPEHSRQPSVGLSRWLPLPVIVLSLLLVLHAWVPRLIEWNSGGTVAPRPLTPRGDLAADEKSTIKLFEESSKSVVFVTTSQVGRDYFFNLLEVPRGSGSGFVWDEQGHVVTNYHVVKDASRVRVTLPDQSTWSAVVIGGSEER